MFDLNKAEKRGYLNEDFRMFHLTGDLGTTEMDYHFHDFEKLVILISGKAAYAVEGITYEMRPWDIMLIHRHLIHKPIIEENSQYERIVIYIDTEFAKHSGFSNIDFTAFLTDAERTHSHLLRPGEQMRQTMEEIAFKLESALKSNEFAAEAESRALFIQLLIAMNRAYFSQNADNSAAHREYDTRITETLDYINENLAAKLSVGDLAARSYMSRYHFMRRFKEQTGCTVHEYINQKRLLRASEFLQAGIPAMRVSQLVGYGDYSSFQRAFSSFFGITPSRYIAEK